MSARRTPTSRTTICVVFLTAVTVIVGTVHGQDASARPHVPRQGQNLVPNPTFNTNAEWSLFADAKFDGSTSRTNDGSGSVKLVTPIPDGSMVYSGYIPISGGKNYTCGFYLKTINGPTYVGAQISIYSRNKQFIRNLPSARGGATRDGDWQEFALPICIPQEASFVRIQAYKVENTKPDGQVWVDDFYLGEGIGLEQPPAPKRGFLGQHVRVDSLGNFEIKKKGGWTPIFLLCMYADNRRDWSVYSRQGWNVNIWAGSAAQVKRAKKAVSGFNPDGMLAGFSIAQYTMPSGSKYNRLDHVRLSLRKIYAQGLGDNLLLFYWDNEVHHDQWQVPVEVIKTIKDLDVDSSGKPLHPIYALQGSFNIARVHAAKGLVDISGVYVGGSADAKETAQGCDELLFLDRLEQQVSPAAFAQFNGVDGPGDMRLRLYNSIIMGAKAIGYWRDCYKGCDQGSQKSVGPVDQKAWWPDFPNLRREVDQLLPIIREPHWTSWTVKCDAPGQVCVGTRDHQGEGYLILVNQQSQQQAVAVTLQGLPYEPREVRDFFNENKRQSISGGTFSIVLPPIGIGSGVRVLRMVAGNR